MSITDVAEATRERLSTSWRSVVVVSVVVLGALAVAFVLLHLTGVKTQYLATDPDDIADLPVYYGAMALFGFTVWGVAIGGAAVGAVAHRGLPDPARVGRMLGLAALFSAYLALDDMYELHENGYPNLGIPQLLVIGGYMVVALGWLWASRAAVLASEFPILLLAFAGFGLSVLIDQGVFGDARGPFIEDVPKVLGLCLWALYLARTSVALVRGRYDGAGATAPAEAAADVEGRRAGL